MKTHFSPFARRKSRRGFTLIEILVVVGILAILIGIGVFVGAAVKRGAYERSTKLTLATLRLMMMDFEKNNPEPPANNWLPALKSDPTAASALKNLNGFSGTDVKDAYGGTIVYVRSVGQNTPNGFVVVQGGYFMSPGADGMLGNLPPLAPNADNADNLLSEPVVP